MTQAPPLPSDNGSQFQALMTWAQNQQDQQVIATPRLHAVRVRLAVSPLTVTKADEIVQVTAVTDRDTVTVDANLLTAIYGISRTVTIMKADASGNTLSVVNPSGFVQFAASYTITGRGTSVTFYAVGPNLFIR